MDFKDWFKQKTGLDFPEDFAHSTVLMAASDIKITHNGKTPEGEALMQCILENYLSIWGHIISCHYPESSIKGIVGVLVSDYNKEEVEHFLEQIKP